MSVAEIPLTSIRLNSLVLRSVDKTNPEYTLLVDSIKKNGLFSPISVRKIDNPEDPSVPLYSLVDGGNRREACLDAGMKMIPANIIDIDESNVLEAQIIANAARIETKPVEYSKALRQILSMNPSMTMRELASRLSRSEQWLGQRLNLVKLPADVAKQVNDGLITVTNAIALASLPPQIVGDYVDRAKGMPQAEFVPLAQQAKTAYRKALSEGGSPKTGEFVPTSYLQKLVDIKSEHENPAVIRALITTGEAKDPVAVAKLVLAWVLHLDPVSVSKQKEDWEADKKKTAEEKANRKLERSQREEAEAKRVLETVRG